MTALRKSYTATRWWATLLILSLLLQMGAVSVVADDAGEEPPSTAPSEAPIAPPTTSSPSIAPSGVPNTVAPTGSPSGSPTTSAPTSFPSGSPTTSTPSDSPSGTPPTLAPTGGPTALSSGTPSLSPTVPGTDVPSIVPTEGPTAPDVPTQAPSMGQSSVASTTPSSNPSGLIEPSGLPSIIPSSPPSIIPSLMPSSVPVPGSGVPSLVPSQSPSLLPSVAPSSGSPVSPSAAPTTGPIMTTGEFRITLSDVASAMDADTTEQYTAVAFDFLSQQLGQLEQPIVITNLTLTAQALGTTRMLRRLQMSETLSPLDTDMLVMGEFEPFEGMLETADDVDLGELCSDLFRFQGTSLFLPELQSLESPFGEYFATVNEIDSSVDGNGPTPTPAPTPGEDGGSSGISTGAIIGIAVAGGVFVALVGGFLWQRRGRGGNDAASWGQAPDTASAAGRQNRFFASSDSEGRHIDSGAEDGAIPLQRTGSDDLSYLNSDVNSQLGADTLMGDSMSYAYSLDHGFDAQSQAASDMSPMNYTSTAPIPTEIPNMGSIPMPAGGDMITRECFAPPGKLGIVIDTTLQGPVIHTVNPGSPLEGVLWPGDRLVAIDSVDCRTMSATAITELMAKTADKRRKLTILSDTA